MEKETRTFSENADHEAAYVQEAAEVKKQEYAGYSENGEHTAAPAFDSLEEELSYYQKEKQKADTAVHSFSENG